MALYRYKAKNENGKIEKGQINISNEQELYNRLRTQGVYLISSTPVKSHDSKRLKLRALAEFNRALGTLLYAGVSLVKALGIIYKEESLKEKERNIYKQLLRSVRQGMSLSEAMKEQGDCFPALMIYMYQSAEASGSMDKVAQRMAEHFEKEHQLKAKVSGAMVYPSILIVMIILVVGGIFTYIIPQFEELFSGMESLPFLTRIMLALSSGIRNHYLLIQIILMIIIPVVILIFRHPALEVKKGWLILRIPLLGRLIKVVYTARFARTLSSLYASGIPIILALQISKNTIGNRYIENQFEAVISRIRAGQKLSEGLRDIDGFVVKLALSITIGEETGTLDYMLLKTANALDYDAESAINKMISFMEPALIIIMAIIVAVVMLSVIMPIYGSYNAIENTIYK